MDRDDMDKSGETTVDLSSVMVVERTEHYDSTEAARLQGHSLSSSVEANVILIAHPEGEMLGTRFRLPPSGTLEIGRSSATDISLPNVRSLSRLHARRSARSILRRTRYWHSRRPLGSRYGGLEAQIFTRGLRKAGRF